MNRTRLFSTVVLGVALSGAAVAQVLRTETDVRVMLEDEGYIDVANVELSGGLWLAEGVDSMGRAVTLRIDPDTSDVITSVIEEVTPSRTVTEVREVRTTTRPGTVTEVIEVPRSTPMSSDEAIGLLHAAGYNRVHDVSFRDGRWIAEAYDPTGDDREVHIDAFTGAIVHVEDD